MTHPNGVEIVYQDASYQWRRVRFEPMDCGYRKETAVHTGCSWRVTGTEPVSKVDIDVLGGAADTYPGP